MTLTTHVALTGPIDADTAFVFALQALFEAGGLDQGFDSVRTRTETIDGDTTVWTIPGQGLPGIVTAHARQDGTQLDTAEYTSYFAGIGTDAQQCNALIAWDTALGYYGPVAANVDQLHAAAITLLHSELPADVTLRWRHEPTGTWHDGLTGLDLLADIQELLTDILRSTRPDTNGPRT
ncbi:hypothetical protein CH252_19015 [Rhodococcus sp. 06-1477-1B]|nr:hypothetical protein CH252_19015 [Rhodococcus sp. 06-1477-1B]